MPRCILLIVIDCLRADHVSCYGYPRPTTPTLDKLAGEGVMWTRAHSTSSWTKPSVASLLTGQYPAQHGAFQGIKRSKGRTTTTDILQSDKNTLAEALTEGGWRCAAFINNAQLGAFTRLDRGFGTYLPTAGKADRLIGAFRQWLEADLNTPSFAYLHFLEAHWPYKPRRRHIAMFGGNRDTNHFCNFSARDYGRLRRAIARRETTLGDDLLEQMIQMYDGAVRRLDGKLKIVLGILAELGLRDDTAVFVTADHGEEFMDHGQLGHGQSLYDELTHVPLVGFIPSGPAGLRRVEPVSQVDLAHTMSRLAGVDGNLPGADLLANEPCPRPVCAELLIRRSYTQTIQIDQWKLHRKYKFESPNGAAASTTIHDRITNTPHLLHQELYNVATDPGERTNLTDDPRHANHRDQIENDLDRWWDEATSGRPEQAASEIEIDEQVVQRLRNLGYID